MGQHGGVEIGAIASAFTISIAIGINAGVGLLLMLPVLVLTPLVKRPIESYYNRVGGTGEAARVG